MHNKFAPFLVLLTALFVVSCGEEPTAEEYLVNAQQLLQSGDQKGALIELKNAARVEPFNMQVRRDMAHIYVDMGQGAEAEKEARRAHEMGLPETEAALLLSRAMMQQGKFEELLEEADEFAAEASPEVQGEIMAWRGLALMELGELELAGRSLEVALQLDPDSPLALSATASHEARVGNVDEAREWVERALESNPESPDALALQGDLFAAEGKLEEAREFYTKSIANRGYPTMVNARRAMVSLRLEDLNAARLDIGALHNAGMGKLAYVHEVRGLLLYLQEKYVEASVELGKGLEAAPRNLTMKVYLVLSLLAQERYEQADVVLGQLYAQAPDSVTVARMRASLDVGRADVDSARQTLESVLAETGEGDDRPTLLGMLGAMAMIDGDPDAAVGYFERVLAAEPENERAQRSLVRARAMRGDFIERDLAAARETVAEDRYQEVLLSAAAALRRGEAAQARDIADNLHRQFPQRTGALKVVAAAQMTSGDFVAGRATMESILEIDPLDPSTTRNLAKVYWATGESGLARRLLNDYLEVNPEDSLARAVLSGVVVDSEGEPAAAAALEEMLSQDPGNHAVRARLVKLRFDAGDFEQVIVLTENLESKAIIAQPVLIELRGKAFANLGQGNMVRNTWEQWVDTAPDSVLANYYHADGLASQGQFEEAMRVLSRAVELNDNYLPARLAQVRMTAAQGDLAVARALMDQLQSDVEGDRVEVWRTEGWLAVREERYTAAESAFRRALELEPDSETALLLAITLSTLGREDAAVAELERWRAEFPEELRFYAMLGDIYTARDADRARELYAQMLTVAPNSILALNNLAWLARESDPEQALDYAERAHDLLPEDPVVLDTYGTLLADSGKLVAGGKMVASAVDAQPENLRYRLNYGRILARQGRARDAREQLDRVVADAAESDMVEEAREVLDSLRAQ